MTSRLVVICLAITFALCGSSVSAQSRNGGAVAARAQLAQAEQAFQAGDLTRATQLYSNMLERDSDQPFLWFRLGVAHQQMKRFRPALQAYDNALSHAAGHDGDPELRATVAKVHFNRALLLLDAAAEDLQQIPADALDAVREPTRATVQELIAAALQSAGSTTRLDSPQRSAATSRARAYIYTADPQRPGGVSAAAHTSTGPAPVVIETTRPEDTSMRDRP